MKHTYRTGILKAFEMMGVPLLLFVSMFPHMISILKCLIAGNFKPFQESRKRYNLSKYSREGYGLSASVTFATIIIVGLFVKEMGGFAGFLGRSFNSNSLFLFVLYIFGLTIFFFFSWLFADSIWEKYNEPKSPES